MYCSTINLALLFWLVALLHREDFPQRRPGWYTLGMFVFLAVTPAGWALLARLLRQAPLLRRPILLPSPTAWVFYFDQRQPCWVLFHLKTGKMLGGCMGKHSAAAHFRYPEDIYVEEIWRIDEEGRFLKRVEQSAGALVKRDECAHIEFFRKGK